MKHYYDQSKHKTESKEDWKSNDNNKGKLVNKRGKSWDINDKENVAPLKKFNASDRGYRFQSDEKNKGDGRKPLQCHTFGKNHR